MYSVYVFSFYGQVIPQAFASEFFTLLSAALQKKTANALIESGLKLIKIYKKLCQKRGELDWGKGKIQQKITRLGLVTKSAWSGFGLVIQSNFPSNIPASTRI